MLRKLLATVLAVQVLFLPGAVGQQATNPQPKDTKPSDKLKVLVLEGQGAVNIIDKLRGVAPIVEVRDDNDRPVDGATVVFRLPPDGPSGYFPGEQLSKMVKTSGQGQAVASGFVPNRVAGRLKIHVTATIGNKMGEIDIPQTNAGSAYAMTGEKTHHKMAWWKWAAIGGGVAAVAGIIILTRGGSSSSTSSATVPTITINPGPVTIGGH